MFATSAMQYIRFLPRCGYGVALNVDCKTMRPPRPFLMLSHFPYLCNARVHFLALTAPALVIYLSLRPCVCTQHIFYSAKFLFLPSPRRFPALHGRIGNDLSLSLHSISKLPRKNGDGTKSRVDRARFVLPAPSLIHSGPSIERIKRRVSDVVRKKNFAPRS